MDNEVCPTCGCTFPSTNHAAVRRNIAALAHAAAHPDLVGVSEIAQMAGKSRQRVWQLSLTKGWPEPAVSLRSGRLWLRATIQHHLDSDKRAKPQS